MAAGDQHFTEIFSFSQNPDLSEAGGGHGQKGVDFQRYWAMVRIFELKSSPAPDFLILFESVQDVAELDSEESPVTIDIYQVKKKDAGEWSFNSLTGLPKPDGRKKKVSPTVQAVEKSPLGKLYKAGLAFTHLKSKAHFVSNLGCDLPLDPKGTASGRQLSLASELDHAHATALSEGLALLHSDGATPNLSTISLRKTALSPDDPDTLAVGAVFKYLSTHLPPHAEQAQSLVDALFAHLSKLGRQTEPVHSFSDLRRQRGFSMSELNAALSDLMKTPDLEPIFNTFLDGLIKDGLGATRALAIKVAATRYFSSAVNGSMSDEEKNLISDCAAIAATIASADPFLPVAQAEVAKLAPQHTLFKEAEVFAYLILQVTKYVAAQL
ncbi:dsDNA nuclease domain-containing protein [Paraburkholderia graminis]|uniref:dsDNA nuclease domain-containing protein n=1 Tax=Paraburkholderia graminis TaxID=60548 RepID=UPI0003F637FE